ncbi:MAG: molybdate ABC transporter permease subunit [Chloroflexi bacterium]|nr:molybdate ABC transporter permease subunit [Chloroflexota bacterium]
MVAVQNITQNMNVLSLSGASRRPRIGIGLVWLAAGLFLLLLGLPVVAVLWRTLSVGGVGSALRQPLVIDAAGLTIATCAVALAISLAFGTPLAYLLARRSFPGKTVVESLTTLPLVLPPLVAGVALLMAFGRRGLLGDQLAGLGITLPFTSAAVVLAQVFVAGPFYLRSAKLAFASVPPEIEQAAAVDGATGWLAFRHITLPLASRGIVAGLVLCAARAASEFGATLMFAGNIGGKTQTMSLAIESAIETNLGAALALSTILVLAAAGALMLLQHLGRGHEVI